MKRDWMQVLFLLIHIFLKCLFYFFFAFGCFSLLWGGGASCMLLLYVLIWYLQTGRKPSGICGEALYISALSHVCIGRYSGLVFLLFIFLNSDSSLSSVICH
ncbi:hypothetical protein Dimus_032086 [Dionaea muscipula]